VEINVYYDIAKYLHVKLDREKALEFIDSIISKHGITRDLEETRRVIENFDEFYSIARRKSDGYLIIQKDSGDVVRGRVVVHKIRLIIEGNVKTVELIIDRRVSRELIESCLREIGFSKINYVEE